jgi:hypothetical protein
MRKRLAIVAVILLSIWIILACSISQLRPERQASVTATPSRTPKPTFTATATATHTLTPSPTPTPSNTPTNTPIATNTPLPTDTPPPTLTPTNTATPLPTNTPRPTTRPTSRPTRGPTAVPTPGPTKPPPLPFSGTIVRGDTHCGGYRGVTGFVKHANGSVYPGVSIGVWSDAWSGQATTSEASGKYEVPLANVPPGKFKVAVVRLETCNQQDGRPTAADCQRLSNVIEVTITENCTGAGANQVSTVDFTGP